MMFMEDLPWGTSSFKGCEWGVASGNANSPFAPPHSLASRHIEFRLLPAAVAAQRAFLADRVRALEDPVLPRGEAREDFRFHRLGADEAQVGFHAGEAVGREAGAFLQKHANRVVPVNVVERESDETELFGLLGVQSGAHRGFSAFHIGLTYRGAAPPPREAMG